MKIKELISELKKYDEDVDVYIWDYEEDTHCWDIEVRSQIVISDCWETEVANDSEKAIEIANTNKWYNAKFKRIVTIFYDY